MRKLATQGKFSLSSRERAEERIPFLYLLPLVECPGDPEGLPTLKAATEKVIEPDPPSRHLLFSFSFPFSLLLPSAPFPDSGKPLHSAAGPGPGMGRPAPGGRGAG